MFERFSEDARRALFFARATTTQRQGDSIIPEDLLRGIVWACPHLLARFTVHPTDMMMPAETAEAFLSQLGERHGTSGAHASKEIRFSATTVLALERGGEEADQLRHRSIRPEHLLLGLLREENSQAWRTLYEAGITLREVRRIMGQEKDEHNC